MKQILFALLMAQLFVGCRENKSRKINIGFEKIIFSTYSSDCYCPSFDLELDSNKKIKLYAPAVYKKVRDFYKPDTAKQGYFIGVAKDSSFNKLANILDTIGIANLSSRRDNSVNPVQEGSVHVIIYYNGKKKDLDTDAQNIYDLISTLREICENSTLQRTEKFKIEGDDYH